MTHQSNTPDLRAALTDLCDAADATNYPRNGLCWDRLWNCVVRARTALSAPPVPLRGAEQSKKAKLPRIAFAVFDEFGKSADDRVQDYAQHCMEQGAWAAQARQRLIGYISPQDVAYLAACNGQSVWVESAFVAPERSPIDGWIPIYAALSAHLAGTLEPVNPTMTRDELIAAAESIGMRVPTPKPDGQGEATAKALEFAEYMAKGAEHLLTCINAHAKVVEQTEQPSDLGIHTPEGLQQWRDNALEHVTEAMTGLRSEVYEFRKRAAKVAHPHPAGNSKATGDAGETQA